MRKGCGAASGGGGAIIGGGTAGLYAPTLQNHHHWGNMVQRNGGNGGGGGRIFLSSHHHPHSQHQQGGGPYGSAAAAAAAALHQSGLLLGHHSGHPGAGGGGGGGPQHHQQQQHHQQHHSHHHHQSPHQGLHRPPSHLLSGQFQNSHLGGHGGGGHHNNQHQFGGGGNNPLSGGGGLGGGGGVVNSSLNSHFNSISSSSTSGGGSGGGGIGGGSASSSSYSGCGGGGGVGDMPPVETVVARLETACRLLHGIGGNNTRVAEISSEIQILSEDLRRVGAMLENTYPEVLDRVMSSMRDASAQPCLPPSLRLAIFELVELRASKWLLPSDSSNYYRQRRNLNEAAADPILDERSPTGRSNSGGGGGASCIPGGTSNNSNNVPLNNNSNNVSVIVTNCASGGGGGGGGGVSNNPIKPEVIFPTGSTSPSASATTTVDNTATPPPAKTYREEIVIKNSDSGKVAPTAKERVLSINGYSQQSINLAKQLIQETITRNASPVLEGMVLPSSSSSCGDFPDMAGLDEVELGLKRMQMQSSSSVNNSPHHHLHSKLESSHQSPQHGGGGSSSSHFSYTVTLGDHSIKILGDDLQYVQEAKMALDDYFLQKYPDLFCASNSIEDVDEEEDEELDVEEDFQEEEEGEEGNLFSQRYDRETLLSLSKVRTHTPDFSHLEADIRGIIILEKRRDFDLDKFTRETSTSTIPIAANQQHPGLANNINNNKVTQDSLPG